MRCALLGLWLGNRREGGGRTHVLSTECAAWVAQEAALGIQAGACALPLHSGLVATALAEVRDTNPRVVLLSVCGRG
jgi:hypothetical protein